MQLEILECKIQWRLGIQFIVLLGTFIFNLQAVLEPVLGQKYLSTSGATVESLVVSRGDPVLYTLKTKNSTKISGSFTELS